MKNFAYTLILSFTLFTGLPLTIIAQDNNQSLSPKILPGKGLSQHSFLYTGEWDYRKPMQTMFVVRDSKVVWSYGIPIKDEKGVMQELGDATLMPNGNILFCKKIGASIVTPQKKIIWNIDAEPGTEIHSVQPLSNKKVLIVQNGNPAKLMTIDIKKNVIEKTIILPTGAPEKSHLQFRRVRLTNTGTYLAAHLDNNKVAEYDSEGKEIWAYNATAPWSAQRLKNGNTLISTYPHKVIEVNNKGEIVWQFSQEDAPEYKFFIFQDICRLPNGNTIICNWCPGDVKDTKDWAGTVQVLEVTPDKKIVWALSQWDKPDLGPASSIQLLDEPNISVNAFLKK